MCVCVSVYGVCIRAVSGTKVSVGGSTCEWLSVCVFMCIVYFKIIVYTTDTH